MEAPRDLNPLEKLEGAVTQVPPNVEEARLALSAIGEYVEAAEPEERPEIAGRAAELAGDLVVAAPQQRDREEFHTYAKTLGAFARMLAGAPAQTAATQTSGKNQTGGKS